MGEQILEDTNSTSYPSEVQEVFEESKNSFSFNASILSNLIKYSWLIVIIVIALIIFIWARTTVEYSSQLR
ncbi:MAG: hypothetical protein QXJ14_02030 [Candidatus Aenigmatarchaeota archaeon]